MNNEKDSWVWAYGLDGWKKVQDPFGVVTGDYEELLREQGYISASTLTSGIRSDIWGIEVMKNELDSAVYPYIVFIPDVDMDHFTTVFVEDFPSLLALMKESYAYQNMSVIELWYEFMTDAVNRAFRAWHGHDANSFCDDCDPEEYRRFLERRERIRKSRP